MPAETLIAIVVSAIAVSGFGIFAWSKQPTRWEIWAQVARHYDVELWDLQETIRKGRKSIEHRLHLTAERGEIEIEVTEVVERTTQNVGGRIRQQTLYRTQYAAHFPPDDVNFVMTTRHRSDRLRSDDDAVVSAEFERRVAVKPTDPTKMRAFLTPERERVIEGIFKRHSEAQVGHRRIGFETKGKPSRHGVVIAEVDWLFDVATALAGSDD